MVEKLDANKREKMNVSFRFENNPNIYQMEIILIDKSTSFEEQQKKYLESKSEELKISNYNMYSLYELNSGMFITKINDLTVYPEGTIFVMKNCSLYAKAINKKIIELLDKYNNPEGKNQTKVEKKEKNEDDFDFEEKAEEENIVKEEKNNINDKNKEKQNIENIKTKAMNSLKKICHSLINFFLIPQFAEEFIKFEGTR